MAGAGPVGRRRPVHRARHPGDVASVGQPTRIDGGDEGSQVGLARKLGIQALEALGGRREERRGIATAPEVERHLGPHALKLGAAELVERAGVGGGQERLRGQEVRGLELGAGGRQGP